MKNFKYLDHTSEAKFQAFGKTLEEAFSNAALAMTNIMTDVSKIKQKESKKINIESNSKEALLYDFLDEIIYVLDVDTVFVSSFKNMKIENKNGKFSLQTTLEGDKAQNYEKGGEVKAPTYDEMKIEKTKDGWMIQAVVDV